MKTGRNLCSKRLRLPFLVVVCLGLMSTASAQFGISKKDQGTETHEVKADGSTAEMQTGVLTEQDAADIQALLEQAQGDSETANLVAKMKQDAAGELESLRALSAEEILGGMKQAVDELRALEYLFEDDARALQEMEKAGMIDPKHIDKYKANPGLLEEDVRKSIYFQFIALAVVGGFFGS